MKIIKNLMLVFLILISYQLKADVAVDKTDEHEKPHLPDMVVIGTPEEPKLTVPSIAEIRRKYFSMPDPSRTTISTAPPISESIANSAPTDSEKEYENGLAKKAADRVRAAKTIYGDTEEYRDYVQHQIIAPEVRDYQADLEKEKNGEITETEFMFRSLRHQSYLLGAYSELRDTAASGMEITATIDAILSANGKASGYFKFDSPIFGFNIGGEIETKKVQINKRLVLTIKINGSSYEIPSQAGLPPTIAYIGDGTLFIMTIDGDLISVESATAGLLELITCGGDDAEGALELFSLYVSMGLIENTIPMECTNPARSLPAILSLILN